MTVKTSNYLVPLKYFNIISSADPDTMLRSAESQHVPHCYDQMPNVSDVIYYFIIANIAAHDAVLCFAAFRPNAQNMNLE